MVATNSFSLAFAIENSIYSFTFGNSLKYPSIICLASVLLMPIFCLSMRSNAKSVNFGIIYGISAFGLSQNIGISRTEAKQIIDGYFKEFPKVKEYMEFSIAKARENEFVATILGRRRYVKDINSRNGMLRAMAVRNAINAPIQGSAADIIKKAMIDVQSEMEKQNLKSKMLLQVHDELVFDMHKEEENVLKNLVKQNMENAVESDVPIIVDLGIGNNWLEAH
jgi:DNA polymerase-1